MKIIFLDFDGVIITPKTRFNSVDHECMQWLSRLVYEDHTTKIVITSTWRKGKSLEYLRGILGRSIHETRVIGVTDILDHRGKEIKKWLDDNTDLDIESIVVLDDESFDLDPFKGFLVKPNGHVGMTEENFEQAKEMLDKPFSL
jgi:hypothetical protein